MGKDNIIDSSYRSGYLSALIDICNFASKEKIWLVIGNEYINGWNDALNRIKERCDSCMKKQCYNGKEG